MKTKLLKKLRKRFRIVYIPAFEDTKCYHVISVTFRKREILDKCYSEQEALEWYRVNLLKYAWKEYSKYGKQVRIR